MMEMTSRFSTHFCMMISSIRYLRRNIVTSLHLTTQRFASSFKVLGIQQVAIGGLDKGALSSFWVDMLGVKKVGEYRAEKENGC